MFGITDENVLERPVEPARGDRGTVLASLRYNQAEPRLVRDGDNVVEVVDLSDDGGERYRIDYCGYLTGSLVVTREGLRELGAAMLDTDEAVPRWTLSLGEGVEDDPWWVSTGHDPDASVECDECGDAAGVCEIVTPMRGEHARDAAVGPARRAGRRRRSSQRSDLPVPSDLSASQFSHQESLLFTGRYYS